MVCIVCVNVVCGLCDVRGMLWYVCVGVYV